MFKSCSTIGIVALSGPCEKDEILNGINNLKSLGYNVVCSKNLFSEEKYLAGTDEEKIIELHSMFENDKIDLILNAVNAAERRINVKVCFFSFTAFCG